MKIYIGVRRGQKPDGVYDPGAVKDGLVEHELAHQETDGSVRNA